MKMKSPPESSRTVSPLSPVRTSIASSASLAVRGHDLAPEAHVDVRASRELVDQVPRHALLEALAAVEDRDAARVGREEHRRLPGRVAGADDVDVEPVHVRRLAAGGAVEDALADEPVEAVDRELPPRDAAGEDDRPRAQHVAAVEVHLVRHRVDPRDRPRDEDLGAEPPRLLQRAARELVARDAGREAEVVLDPGRGAGLAARRLALDDERAQTLRGAVDGGGEPGRAGADHDHVVLGRFAARCRARAARPPGGAAAGRPSCRRRAGSPDSRSRPAAARPTARPRRVRPAAARGS